MSRVLLMRLLWYKWNGHLGRHSELGEGRNIALKSGKIMLGLYMKGKEFFKFLLKVLKYWLILIYLRAIKTGLLSEI